ncbi:MAG: glycoside hydrolase family 65 protein [Chloroflexi bacterium]|nr:MAG: glycoside hydrolase family 65 protein [Chloroflexota bacterium]
MEVRHARKAEELVDQEPEDLRGAEEEGHAEGSRGRDQQRPGSQEEEKEVAPGRTPLSPPAVAAWRPEYIPAYLSSGLIGLRAGPIPLTEGLAIVNGLAAIDPVEQGEGFARGPYPIGGDIELDGQQLSRLPRQSQFVEQRHDFSCGELSSRFRFRSGATTATVDVLTLCSRSLPTVVLQEVRVRVDQPCRLVVTAKLDPTGITGRWRSRETSTPGAAEPVVDGSMLWEVNGALSTCGAAYITRFDGGEGVERRREEHDQLAPLSTSYSVDARPERSYVLQQLTSLVPSQSHHEPDRQAARLVGMAARRGFQKLRVENRGAWEEIWKGRIKLIGAGARWQSLSDAAYYYLHASAHSSSLFSTSMFGLAYWPNYHYYRGHVMWDIEAFTFPTLLLTAPESAYALLEYRAQRLTAAERNAALHGYRGLQFPWASGPRHGEEVIRLSAPHLVFEQHVSLSVARAFAQYVHATGDDDYLREKAWPVLEGVANWLVSRAIKTDRGYELKEVIGIAEQTDPVDNNAYMNMAASVVLREAAGFARRLNRADAQRWDRMADAIHVPIDNTRGYIRNHDRYSAEERGPAASTPEALAGIFPMDYPVEPQLERATIDFYLGRAGEYVGRPMLSALLGVYAARAGDRAESVRWFERGYADFIEDPFMETNEFSLKRFPDKPRVGPFMANLGGFLMSCLYGLTGLVLSAAEPAAWFTRPVVLPEGWDAIEVDRLFVRGRPARLLARHGENRASLTID